ncbi:MAG: hypothetical protein A2W31_00095 [Planctomycetes bacterium RBG_16_64_10]|nr:MAG: hypothetical protein A2W31_00095 [Planctomycetes bacterium RBG_16_64_10]
MGNRSDGRLAVCVITFRRPERLRRLLAALDQLQFPRYQPVLEVVVVDNDPAGSAKPVCTDMSRSCRWPLHYEIEPVRGIPYARNKAVASALCRVDAVAFIDDDEVPRPTWLDELLEVQRVHAADIVTGPTIRHADADAPCWVKRSLWLQPRRYPTGRRLTSAFSGNVLIQGRVFRQMAPWFDERIGLGGGSDVEFFRRAQRSGYTIVWADAAVVDEWMPASRLTAKWLLLRAFSLGNAAALLEVQLGRPVGSRLAVAGQAVLLVIRGLGLLPWRLLRGRRGVVQSLWYVCRAAGMLSGLTGYRFAYYRDAVHGDP